jgi:hypothetical protein
MIIFEYEGQRRGFPNKMLAEVCLEVAGGGYTEAQCIKAMLLQDALREHGEAFLMGRKMHLRMTDDGETQKVIDKLTSSA